MTPPTESSPAPPIPAGECATRKQIRGSTGLLLGRCLALVINLAVQVVAVRYLAKADYGAFAFGLTMVALVSNLAMLGLPKSLARFVPIYREHGDHARVAGSIVLMFGTVLALGSGAVVLAYGLHGEIAARAPAEPASLSVSILLLLMVLVPIESLDRMMDALFAIFGNVRSIFIRRHVIGPGLKLLAVLSVVAWKGDVRLLASFYVAAGVLGIIYYGLLLWQTLDREGLLPYFRPDAWYLPASEVLRFSLPLFISQFSFVVKTSLPVLLLEVFHSSSQVADLRAVFPFARLNEVVLGSFHFLFIPVAASMFARRETDGIDHLYWQTSVWITVFSLPAFLVTGILAGPFTIAICGQQYGGAGPLLMVLSIGFFVDSALGFNLHTLRVFAKVRQIVFLEIVTFALGMGLCLLLIPAGGAMGAAIAISVATVVQNLLGQVMMRTCTGVGVLHWTYIRFYLTAIASLAALGLIIRVWAPPLPVGLGLTGVFYAMFVYSQRSVIDVSQTFPELLRLPLLGRILNVSRSGAEPGSVSNPRKGSLPARGYEGC